MTTAPELAFAPALRGVDLTYVNAPDWLRDAWVANRRFGKLVDANRINWHNLYRSALDYSRLGIVPRNVAHRIVDWHGARDEQVAPRSADLAARVPCHPGAARRALDDLARDGWLLVEDRPGCPSGLTLLVPWELSTTPRPRRGVNDLNPAPTARGTPRPQRAPPRPQRGDPAPTARTQAHRRNGAVTGARVNTSRDATREAPPAPVDVSPGFIGVRGKRTRLDL